MSAEHPFTVDGNGPLEWTFRDMSGRSRYATARTEREARIAIQDRENGGRLLPMRLVDATPWEMLPSSEQLKRRP